MLPEFHGSGARPLLVSLAQFVLADGAKRVSISSLLYGDSIHKFNAAKISFLADAWAGHL